jgi:hypothetical protein
MDIKEVVQEIRTRLGEEELPKVETYLKEIERNFLSVVDDLKAANAESKSRKLKLRELQEQLENVQAEAEKLKDTSALDELKKENEQLKEFQKQIFNQNKEKFMKEFSEIAKHPAFEKIKDKIKLPEPDGENWKFESLTDEDVQYNLQKLNEYKELGIFETKQATKSNVNISPPTLPDNVDIVELAKKDPEAARAWLDKKRKKQSIF